MALCRHCVSHVPFGSWWCPNCGRRSEYAPKGVARVRPPDLPSPDPELAPVAESAGVPPAAQAPAADFGIAPQDPEWKAAYCVRLSRRRRRRQIAGGIAGTALVLLAALLIDVLHGGQAGVVVPLTFDQKPYGDVFNPPPIARVVIGKNHAVPVLVDTGSVGLRVFASAISAVPSSGVTMWSRRETVQSLDGSIFAGTVASATLRFGSLTTASPVFFQVVDGTTCGTNPLKVNCYRGGDQRALEAIGVDGILGVGLHGPGPGSPVTNPLLSLPGKYGRVWTLDMTNAVGGGTGALILGASPFDHPLVRIRLNSLASSDVAQTWNDLPDLCWMIASHRLCGPTIFDSGATFGYIGSPSMYARAISPGPDLPRLINANQAISISLPDHRAAFWSFDTSGPGSSAVAVANAKWPFLDTGVEAFLTFKFQYDNGSGTIEIENPGS